MLYPIAPADLIAHAQADRAGIIKFVTDGQAKVRDGREQIIISGRLQVRPVFKPFPEGPCLLSIGLEVRHVDIATASPKAVQLVLKTIQLLLGGLKI